jgi:hypothetical protein
MTLAEELAEKICKRWDCHFGIDDIVETSPESIREFANEAILSERERCCKAVCEWCAKGMPMINDLIQFHDAGNGQVEFCAASAIREE